MDTYYDSETIDVVVPIYRGQKYIKGIVSQLEACAERLDRDLAIRLVLVNDAPESGLTGDYVSGSIEILAVDTDRNRGIHGARVRGLSYCTGTYVMFLDQDDRISADYLKSQIEALGSADAVVCRAREDGREVYGRTLPFTGTIDRDKMVSIGNTIVSPGQVLMRREAVPGVWERNILKENGVDDWFLWICMMQQGCHFVLNENILFEHRLGGDNLSWDSGKMLRSGQEMLSVIKKASILDSMMYGKLEELIASEQQRYIHILEKYRRMFFIYDRWMELECRRGSISGYLHSQGIRRAAIYGMGHIGRRLADRIRGTEVTLVGSIDRDAGSIDAGGISIVRLEEFRQDADLVIVTVMDGAGAVLQDIRDRIGVPAMTMQQLLEEWEEGGRTQNE